MRKEEHHNQWAVFGGIRPTLEKKGVQKTWERKGGFKKGSKVGGKDITGGLVFILIFMT